MEYRRVEGAAGNALVASSNGADLLVVGRPHRSGLLPRATTVVVDRATSPVLVVPVSSQQSGPHGSVVIGQDSRPADRTPLPVPMPGASL